MKRIHLLALLLVAGCSSAAPIPPVLPASPVLSGDSAFQTVAFVEQFWRQPGSVGFDTTIGYVRGILERAGYMEESAAPPGAPLTWRIERRPMTQPSWMPLDASLAIEGGDTLLRFSSNRNMLAIGSWSTPDTGVVGRVVDLSNAAPDADLRGAVVYAEGPAIRQAAAAIGRGAIGVLMYRMPSYTQPEKNRTSIQFGSFRADSVRKTWALFLSYDARDALKRAMAAGPVRVRVHTRVDIHPADELMLVAEAHGASKPGERFVLSAHVQEPGANDNATGVATQAEMARVLAGMVRSGAVHLDRTITMIWGDEIRAVQHYLEEDSLRTAGVKWGLSLDMVGEDTRKTGGTFLIEKMPDPSAVWTRGEDHHTEWGGRPLKESELTPHYFNDLVVDQCQAVAATVPGGWVVRTNPFEGGSDHTPFLRAGKPGLLFWHFTDQFYHTDNDRLDKVSAQEMANSGHCALNTALMLTTANEATVLKIIADTRAAALGRIATEARLSADSIAHGGNADAQHHIVDAWRTWYVQAIESVRDIGIVTPAVEKAIEEAVGVVGGKS